MEQAIEGDEGVADYHYWLAGAYGDMAREAGVPMGLVHARRMKKECERAIELDPAHTGARYRLVQYYLEVPRIFGGSARKALEAAEELKTLDRRQGSDALILVYRAEEEHDQVVAEYRELIAAYPDERGHRTNLINYLTGLSRYEEAFAVCEDAMRAFQDDPVLWVFYGAIAARSGSRLEQGIEYLQAYLRIEISEGMPSPGGVHFLLGQIYERQNQPERAIAEYEATLSEMPGYQRAVDALERLRPPPGCC